MNVIATTILTNAVAVSVVGFLLKLWVEKQLSHSLDRELERFKAELAKDIARDSIQQTWINDKRMELFEQLYEVMIEMDFEIKTLFMTIKVQSQDLTTDHAWNVCEKYTVLNSILHKNELFLDADVVEVVRSAYQPYFELGMMCMEGDEKVAEKLRDELPDTLEDVTSIAEAPRNQVIQSFRRAAGIDSQ